MKNETLKLKHATPLLYAVGRTSFALHPGTNTLFWVLHPPGNYNREEHGEDYSLFVAYCAVRNYTLRRRPSSVL